MSLMFSSARSSPALRAVIPGQEVPPLPHQRADRRFGETALHMQPFPVVVAYGPAKRFSRTGWRWLGWPWFLYEAHQRMDTCSGNGFRSRRCWVTVALAELLAGVLEIAGHVIRRYRTDGNASLRQVLKKVVGAPAVVVNDDRIKSLLCEKRSELIAENAAVVWHKNLLAELR